MATNKTLTDSWKELQQMYPDIIQQPPALVSSLMQQIIEKEALNQPSPIFYGTGKINDTLKIRQPAVERTPIDMIAMRLRLTPGQRFPMKDIHAYTDSGVAYVFVVNTDGKYVVIEDDPDLFPSDKLITQLRLLIG